MGMRLRGCCPARVLLGSSLIVLLACGDDDGGGSAPAPGQLDGGSGEDAGAPFFPRVEASDPCALAGYVFDGESDCDVVRCPQLSCECPLLDVTPPDDGPPPTTTVTLEACVPGAGCLSRADCARVCDPAVALAVDACEQRIVGAGHQACERDEDCLSGECRQERVGSVCVDLLGCSEDGNCGQSAACLFDPNGLDPITALPTSLGDCATGESGSTCYDDDDCVFGRCVGQRCTAGDDGAQCTLNRNCASGLCRIAEDAEMGNCVSGERASSCIDDDDCQDGLHCSAGRCFGPELGQNCEMDAHCDSGQCIFNRCRSGEPGSRCEDDGDCAAGRCVAGACVSGDALSPCSDPAHCNAGLACVRRVCSDGSLDMPCLTNEECDEGLSCALGLCSAGADGDGCDGPDDCDSGLCADPAGVEPGRCTSGEPGAYCVYAQNCISGTCGFGGSCQ